MAAPADTLLVLVDRPRDRELLAERLRPRHDVRAPSPRTFGSVSGDVALVLVDAQNATRHRSALAAWSTETRVFSPVLLFLGDDERADDDVWRFVTDVIRTPVRRRELDARVETLLRHRRATVALREREAELADQATRLDQFASTVAHDLRNPLNAAMGWLDTARETDDTAAFERVDAAHERMLTLIEDVLELARQGDLVGDLEPVSLDRVVRASWSDVATPDATLTLTDDAADATLLADFDRLYELLGNLFRNAVQHAGSDVTVTVGALDDTSHDGASTTGFYVADDGPGLTEEVRARLFQPGARGGPNAGTGYGLSIVAAIADAHGWTVDATEGDAGGARFEIRGVERPPGNTEAQ